MEGTCTAACTASPLNHRDAASTEASWPDAFCLALCMAVCAASYLPVCDMNT
jgi:hypothetical protein